MAEVRAERDALKLQIDELKRISKEDTEHAAAAEAEATQLQKERDCFKGNYQRKLEDDTKHLAELQEANRLIDELAVALGRAEQFMVTTNLSRAKSRGDYQVVADALGKDAVKAALTRACSGYTEKRVGVCDHCDMDADGKHKPDCCRGFDGKVHYHHR